jgi:two-component system chemotaxis response regulator CheY
MLRILIADESEAVRKVAAHILAEIGFSILESASTLDALAKSQTGLPDILIVDSAMTGALDLIQHIRALPNGGKVKIYYSVTKADLRCLMAGKRAGADDFLLKPFERKALGAAFSGLGAAAAA